MKDELEEIDNKIQHLKQKMSDYLKFTKVFDETPEKIEIQINIMLDDLYKLIEKRSELQNNEY